MQYARDPVTFVREMFHAEPDAWQRDALEAAVTEPRIAMSACKGPGKSCVLAWIIWWFVSTREDASVVAMSISRDNLRDNLWKELAKWQAESKFLTMTFDLRGERVEVKVPGREKLWWVSARAYSQSADATTQESTLAGLHGKHVMVVLDEVGDYPDGVVVTAEGIFANKDIGGSKTLIVAGNPTNVHGPLHRITYRDSKNWKLIRITGDPNDAHRSPRIDIEWARQMIATWGIDNPWVRVNVLGLFPLAGSDQLISESDVVTAQQRDAKPPLYNRNARIWGLDPAGLGLGEGTDEAVLYRRQGINGVLPPFQVWRNKSGVELAVLVATELQKADDKGEKPEALFVDKGGQGASCYEHLLVLGWGSTVIGVDFAGSADEDEKFLNKRAEIWWRMADWIKNQPSCLPRDVQLSSELPAPKFFFRAAGKHTKFQLESKIDMKKRGVSSPNRADALALTFTQPVMPINREARDSESAHGKIKTQYHPLDYADKNDNLHIKTEYEVYGG